MGKRRAWTKSEIKFLRRNYFSKGTKYCSQKLSRTPVAISRMAANKKIKANKAYRKYSKEQLLPIAISSKSVTEMLIKLDLRAAGGNYKTIRRYIVEFKIDTTHFHTASERVRKIVAKPLSEILIEDNFTASGYIKERLYKEGLKDKKCELCGQGEIWRGKILSLILDHKNGIHSDWRIENLRIVCPNCAATLDTHCRGTRERKVKKKDGRKGKGKPRVANRKVKQRPSLRQLIKDVMRMSYLAVGTKYGVSDNAVRKWFRAYGVEPPKALR